jgi:hypothetical protein
MSHFNFKKRAPKQSDNSKLRAKVDTIFSEYIRLRDADSNGMVKCITCGDAHHWTDIDCGHFVRRWNGATRYDLRNSNGQCRTCNAANDGKEDEHAIAIDKIHGPGTADKLRKLGNEELKLMNHELESMYQELRTEVKALRQEKLGLN